MSSVETGQMSAVETGQMSAAETGQMSAVETRQMSSAETRQMSTSKTGRCPVSLFYICLVSAEDISVLSQQQTSVLSQQQTSDCFGVILTGTKMISTPFFHLKCAKKNTVMIGTRPHFCNHVALLRASVNASVASRALATSAEAIDRELLSPKIKKAL